MLRFLLQQLHTLFLFNSFKGLGDEKSKTVSTHELQMTGLDTEQQMCANEQVSSNGKDQNQLNVRAAETNGQVVLSTSINNGSQVATMSETTNPQMTMSAIDIERMVRMEHRREARLSEVEKGCRRQQRRNPEVFGTSNKTAMKCGQLVEDVPANVPCYFPQTREKSGLVFEHPKWRGSNSHQKMGLESGRLPRFESLLASILKYGMSEINTAQNRALVSSTVGPNNLVPRSKDQKVVLPSACTDVILRPKSVKLIPAYIFQDFGLSSLELLLPQSYGEASLESMSTSQPVLGSGLTFLGLGLGSNFPKTEQSRVCMSVVLRSQFVPLTLSPRVLWLGSTSDTPKIYLSQACTDVVLRSKCISSTPAFLPSLESANLASQPQLLKLKQPPNCTALILRPKASIFLIVYQPKSAFADSRAIVLDLGVISHSEVEMQPVCWDVALRRIISSFSALLDLGSVPARHPKRIKLISTSECSEIAIPPKYTSPPIILTSSEFVSNKLDPRNKVDQVREAIQAKAAIRAKIRGESKARAKNAAKTLRNAWKCDPKHIKARKQAEKAAQLAGDKIEELRLKEEKIWTEFEKTYV